MKKRSCLLTISLVLLSTSCFHPKVNLSKEEKKAITYRKKNRAVFESNIGTKDTVFIYTGFPNGYRPGFDYWVDEKYYDKKRPEKRPYLKVVKGDPNFGANRYKKQNVNLYLDILYQKSQAGGGLVMGINLFEENYCLNKYSGTDTLVFKKRLMNIPVDTIRNNDGYIKMIKYTKQNGIVYIKKGNGVEWRLLTRL